MFKIPYDFWKSIYLIRVHDAKNITLANIAVGRERVTLGRILHAGTN